MGPGVVTGASDDDPSGIATYSQVGAQYGLSFLWTALLTLPLMAALQEICDRTALATGTGLGELAVRHFGRAGRAVLGVLLVALIVANALNIAADLVGDRLRPDWQSVWSALPPHCVTGPGALAATSAPANSSQHCWPPGIRLASGAAACQLRRRWAGKTCPSLPITREARNQPGSAFRLRRLDTGQPSVCVQMEPGGEAFRHFYRIRQLPVADDHHAVGDARRLASRASARRPGAGRPRPRALRTRPAGRRDPRSP